VKRSMAVSLVLLGSTAVGLSGCKPKKVESYSNIQACEAAGKYSAQECRDGFAAAWREHQASAPQFPSSTECVAASGPGGCEERHLATGATVFLPLMLGFAVEPGVGYRPLYQYPGRNDCLFTRDGQRFGNCPPSGSGGGRGGFGDAGHGAAGDGGGGHGGGE
jgi:uncharacterized protein YgiB involved in biofilm formation